MKKIGLVSYHRDPNYGTMLQAFALAHTIKKLGYDCEYLNYYEYKQPTVIKKILSKIYHTIKRLLKINYKYLQPIVTQYLVCNKSEIWP